MALEHRQTLGQVVDRTLALCGDLRGARLDGDWFDRSRVRLLLKRLHLETVRATGLLKGTSVIPLEAGARIYNLPYNCLAIRKVMLHGITGSILFPYSQQAAELVGYNLTEAGEPFHFYRDLLSHDQIGIIPTPDADGSVTTQSSNYGVARSVQDDDDGTYITADGNYPGRFVRGVPVSTVGSGLVRSVVSPYGNLFITYERSPSIWDEEDEYPDTGIPTWMHQAFRFGAAAELLGTSPDKTLESKAKLFAGIWRRWLNKLSVYSPMTKTGGMMPA